MLRIPSVGVIGLGPVGGTVARRLLDRGLDVTVHDRDAGTVVTMSAAGATPARIRVDAAEPADLVFDYLPEENAGPAFVLSAADRLRALDLNIMEAWFIGRSSSGPDTVLVGCARAELETVAPVLRLVAGNVAHIGPLRSVSALRAAVTALSTVQPLAPEDDASATTVDSRQVLRELMNGVSTDPVADRRSGRCGPHSKQARTGAGALPAGTPPRVGRPSTVSDVVTTDAASGPTGTTINSFASLSLDPPLVLFCIHNRSRLRAALHESGTFAVNFLAGWQKSLAWAFAGRKSTSQDVAYRSCEPGIPVLCEALAHLACRIIDEYHGGDHRIVVGEVVEVGAPRRREPLIFFQGTFGVLQEEDRVHPICDG